MTSAEFLSGETFESEEELEAFLGGDAWADAFMEMDSYFDDLGDLDGFEAEADFLDEDVQAFEGFELDEASRIYVPSAAPRLVSGPAAVVLARNLNPFVLESMDADDAEAFFRRVARGIRGAVRTVGRGVRTVGRVAAPVLRRALPIVQRVAGLAGPWGRVVAAGIGATRGLLEGRGLRGALAGAVGGLVPGVGGRIASSILRADGADDDAALDALADMADARQVTPAVAIPLGAGLAARTVHRQAVRPGAPLGAAALGVLRSRTRATEQALLRTALRMPGSAGQRLRLIRGIAQRAALQLRRRGTQRALELIPQVVRTASQRVLTQASLAPGLGAIDPRIAAQRVAARQRILTRLPVATLGAASIRQAVRQA
ncbi:hypothetical protein P2318_32140 [Myxococcaceae bacterium GXIMD 01537]